MRGNRYSKICSKVICLLNAKQRHGGHTNAVVSFKFHCETQTFVRVSMEVDPK
jgi:hypothetical protein